MNEEVKGKKSPQLRFSGFKKIENEKLKDENWFSAPASEIFISVNDRNHPELPVLSASQELGMIYRDEGGMNIFHDVANEITYKRVKPGQFVIHLRSFQGGFAHSKVEGITSPAYTILDFKDINKHNDLFWKYVLTSDEFIKRLELITYGIRDGRSINFSDFSTLKFHFPSYEVQQKIGTFLSHVDSLIQAKTQKLDSLKSVKKSLLQKCFPKDGEKVPEIRFGGFSGDWEEKKTINIFETYSEKGFPNLPVLSASQDLGMIFREDFKSDIQYSKNNISGYKRVLPHQFVIHLRSFQGGFAHSKIGGITSPAYTILKFKNESNHSDLFWKYVLTSKQFIKKLETIIYGIREGKSISFEDFATLSFTFPSSKIEQQKIGEFFSKYDSLISLQQKEIDNLKTIKKALLQKMFV